MFKKLMLILSLAAVQSVSAEGFYVGGSFSTVEASRDPLADEATVAVISGRFGAFLTEYFSGEVRLGFDTSEGDITENGITADVEVKRLIGAYLRGGVPITDTFYPYIAIGLTRSEVEVSIGEDSDTTSTTDFSYGVGVDLTVHEKVKVNVEYMSYLHKPASEVRGISIGAAYSF